MGTFPAEVICPRCSKPIRDNSVVLLRQGELFHVRCRSQEVNLEAMETVDRAQRAWGHSAKLAAGLVRLQIARSGSAHAGGCPLCGATATIAYASDEWTAVTVLVRARRLSDEDEPSRWVPPPKHDLCAGLVQRAAGAFQRRLADHRESRSGIELDHVGRTLIEPDYSCPSPFVCACTDLSSVGARSRDMRGRRLLL